VSDCHADGSVAGGGGTGQVTADMPGTGTVSQRLDW
jgi:hypothetical protein